VAFTFTWRDLCVEAAHHLLRAHVAAPWTYAAQAASASRSTASALQPTYNGPHTCDWLRRRVLVLRRLALRDRGQHAGHKVLGACRPAQVQPRRRLRYAGSRGARIAYQTLAGALEPDILLLHGGLIPIQSMARYSKFAVFSVSWHP
jgi:hypothetical protein